MEHQDILNLIREWNIPVCDSIESVAVDLEIFHNLLVRWQSVQNLVSRETLDDIWMRHIFDSMQIVEYINPGASNILDVGSGGGFPVIPMAIATRTLEIDYHLVESNKRKVAFLRTVSRELDLNLHVYGCRLQELEPKTFGNVDHITCRATASLDRLFTMVAPFWSKNTIALFQKGAEFGAELSQCRTNWRFDVVDYPSRVGSSGVILDVRNLKERN